MIFSKFRRWCVTALLAVAAVLPLPALAFSGWVVFGDSLSDSGNNAIRLGIDAGQVIDGNSYIPTYPYASGRYSDAEIWTAGVASWLGTTAVPSLAGGNIHAAGGARTGIVSPDGAPSARDQVAGYLQATGGVADPDALYVIGVGGNNARDTLDAIAAGAPVLQTLLADARRYATDVGWMVDALQAAGAQTIVVWNVPNIALAPAVRAEGSLAVRLAGTVVKRMNTALSRRMSREAGVVVFDTYALFTAVAGDPGAYGLENVTDACGASPGCVPSTHLFWDGIHPTSAGRAIIEAAFRAAVPGR